MPRTHEQLAAAAAEAEAWLDSLDPETNPAQDADDLRRIGLALGKVADSERELEAAVLHARRNGWSWGTISIALGVSKQAARQRYGEAAETTPRGRS